MKWWLLEYRISAWHDNQRVAVQAQTQAMAYARLKELIGEISLVESPREFAEDDHQTISGASLVIGKGFMII